MIVYFTSHGAYHGLSERFLQRFPNAVETHQAEEADVVIELCDWCQSPRKGQLLVRLMRDKRPPNVVQGEAILDIGEHIDVVSTLARLGLQFSAAMRKC